MKAKRYLGREAVIPVTVRDCFDLQRVALHFQALVHYDKTLTEVKKTSYEHKIVWDLSCRMHRALFPPRPGAVSVGPGEWASLDSKGKVTRSKK